MNAILPEYPIARIQEQLATRFEQTNRALLQAPPGSGKSSIVPFYLMSAPWLKDSKAIALLQPRRSAAKSLAVRLRAIAEDESIAGFMVKGESSVPKSARIHVMTVGVFLQQVLEDMDAPKYGAIVFDEFHERSAELDTALVIAMQIQQLFRPDLRLLLMSATPNFVGINESFFPLIEADGSRFPVEIHYQPLEDRDKQPSVWAEIIAHQWRVCGPGSILVFLPGEWEITRCGSSLVSLGIPKQDIVPLFGRLPLAQQQNALSACPEGKKRIILSTNIAETSLTIDGVHTVIDSGLRRISQYDPAVALERRKTIFVSRASAEQRAGRAGRTAAGICIRMWKETERLADHDSPGIQQVDLSAIALTLAAWGDSNPEVYDWPSEPNPMMWKQAMELLVRLGALNKQNTISDFGRQMIAMGRHPRVAAMLLHSAQSQHREAALVAALLEHGDISLTKESGGGANLEDRVEALLRNEAYKNHHGLNREIRQILNRLKGTNKTNARRLNIGELLSYGYPDRIAKRTSDGRYQLPGGTMYSMDSGNGKFAPQWIVAADVQQRDSSGKIFWAAEFPHQNIENRFDGEIREQWTLELSPDSSLHGRHRRALGSIEIENRAVPVGLISDGRDQLLGILSNRGITSLPWKTGDRKLQSRLTFLHSQDSSWPDVSDAQLGSSLNVWLRPFLPQKLKTDSLVKLSIRQAILSIVPWNLLPKLEQCAPEKLDVPSGKQCEISYASGVPRISVRVQHIIGLDHQPRVMGIPVEFELLSPANRPVQITSDLPGFWRGSYAELRKSLRGRYPKHQWPERPWEAHST